MLLDSGKVHTVLQQLLQTDAVTKFSASELALACVVKCYPDRRPAVLEKISDETKRILVVKNLDSLLAKIDESTSAIDAQEAGRVAKIVAAIQKAQKKLADAEKKAKKNAKKEKKPKAAKTAKTADHHEAPSAVDDGEFRIVKRAKIDDDNEEDEDKQKTRTQ